MRAYTGEKLPLWREICYGCGNFTASLFGTIIGTWLSFFYIDRLGFDANAVAGAMIIYSIWNAVNDPIMGYFSDRTKTKLGRRLPYVLFGAIPLGISFIFIFNPPTQSLTTPLSQILYYTLSLCVYDFFFTTVLLNWEAVVPDMYPKEKDRGRILGIAQFFDIFAGVIASVAIQPVFAAKGWTFMAVLFGVIGIVTMLLTVFGISENPRHAQVKPLGFVESFKQTFKSRSFIICVSSVFFVETARLLLMASIPFYAEYVFPEVDMAATILSAVVFISGLLFIVPVLWLRKRVGAKKTYIITLSTFAVCCCGYFFSGSLVFSIVVSVLLGIGVTGGLIMPKLLSAEIIDEDQTVTGRRREGAFYGTHAFVIRFASGVEALIMAGVMDAFGYSSEAAAQAATVPTGFRVSMSFVPAALIAVGIVIITRYPLHGERLDAVKEKIAQMEREAAQTE